MYFISSHAFSRHHAQRSALITGCGSGRRSSSTSIRLRQIGSAFFPAKGRLRYTVYTSYIRDRTTALKIISFFRFRRQLRVDDSSVIFSFGHRHQVCYCGAVSIGVIRIIPFVSTIVHACMTRRKNGRMAELTTSPVPGEQGPSYTGLGLVASLR
jgi:hypothetical protein